MATLQKRALCSFVLGLLLSVLLVVVFATRDIYTFDTDLNFRLIVYALWIGVPLVNLVTISLAFRKPQQIDERDRAIMERAPVVQYLAVLFSLVAWVIALTEVFGDKGQIPVIFLTLMVISALVISNVAQSLGILIGYWKQG
jgi:hypothetical protein